MAESLTTPSHGYRLTPNFPLQVSKLTLQLHYDDRENVTIHPEDEDRFTMTIGEAVRALRMYEQERTFREQLNFLLKRLGKWVAVNRSKMSMAIVTERDSGLLFLVVQNALTYDVQFQKQLTDLDLEIAGEPFLHLIRLSVMAIPPCSKESREAFIGRFGFAWETKNGN